MGPEVKEVPKPSHESPTSKATDEAYDPQGSGQEHDAFFASVAPGSANSGNMEHRYGAEGDHSVAEEPPSGLKGD